MEAKRLVLCVGDELFQVPFSDDWYLDGINFLESE